MTSIELNQPELSMYILKVNYRHVKKNISFWKPQKYLVEWVCGGTLLQLSTKDSGS